MTINFLLDEPDSPALRLERSFLTGRSRLYADEQELISQPKKSLFNQTQTFVVPLPDGTSRQLQLKNRIYDSVPEAQVEGRALLLAKPLETWEYVVAALPVLLVLAGGLIGGAIGAVAAYTNVSIMRSERSMGARIGICLVLLIVAIFAYGLVAGARQLTLVG